MLGGVVLVLLVIIVFIFEVNMTRNKSESSLKENKGNSVMDEILGRLMKVEEMMKNVISGKKEEKKESKEVKNGSDEKEKEVKGGSDEKEKGLIPILPLLKLGDEKEKEEETIAQKGGNLPVVNFATPITNVSKVETQEIIKPVPVSLPMQQQVSETKPSVVQISKPEILPESVPTVITMPPMTQNNPTSIKTDDKVIPLPVKEPETSSTNIKENILANPIPASVDNTLIIPEKTKEKVGPSVSLESTVISVSPSKRVKSSTDKEKSSGKDHKFTQSTNVIIMPNSNEPKKEKEKPDPIVIVPIDGNSDKDDDEDKKKTKIKANGDNKEESLKKEKKKNEKIKNTSIDEVTQPKKSKGEVERKIKSETVDFITNAQIPNKSHETSPKKKDSVLVVASYSKTTTNVTPKKAKISAQSQNPDKKEEKKKKIELEKDKKMWKNKDKLEDENRKEEEEEKMFPENDKKQGESKIITDNANLQLDSFTPLPLNFNNRPFNMDYSYPPFQFNKQISDEEDKKPQGRMPIMSSDENDPKYEFPHNNPLRMSNDLGDMTSDNKDNEEYEQMNMPKMNYDIY